MLSVALLFVVASLISFAEDWVVIEDFGDKQSPNIEKIVQAGTGEIYALGFSEGAFILKFDGENWTVHENPDLNFANDMDVDADGKVWIGTGIKHNSTIEGSVVVFDGEYWEVFKAENTALPAGVTDVEVFENTIWLGCAELSDVWGESYGGLVKIDADDYSDDTNWKIINKDEYPDFKSNYVNSIAIDKYGSAWVASGDYDGGQGGLQVYQTSDQFYNYPYDDDGFRGHYGYYIYIDHNDIKWMNPAREGFMLPEPQGLFRLRLMGNWAEFSTDNSDLENNGVLYVHVNRNDEVLVKTYAGMQKFDGDSPSGWTDFDIDASGLADYEINDIITDFNENVWYATSKGIAVWNDDEVVFGDLAPPAPENLRMTPGDTSIYFQWDPVVPFAGEINYRLYYRQEADAPWGLALDNIKNTYTTISKHFLSDKVDHRFVVRAFNVDNQLESGSSNEVVLEAEVGVFEDFPVEYAIVSPNPFEANFDLVFYLKEPGEVELQIVDGVGDIVKLIDLGILNAGEHMKTFDASNLSPGAYFMSINCKGSGRTLKIINVE